MKLDNDKTERDVFWYGVVCGFIAGAVVGIIVTALAMWGAFHA